MGSSSVWTRWIGICQPTTHEVGPYPSYAIENPMVDY
jgi:hypothetical protein